MSRHFENRPSTKPSPQSVVSNFQSRLRSGSTPAPITKSGSHIGASGGSKYISSSLSKGSSASASPTSTILPKSQDDAIVTPSSLGLKSGRSGYKPSTFVTSSSSTTSSTFSSTPKTVVSSSSTTATSASSAVSTNTAASVVSSTSQTGSNVVSSTSTVSTASTTSVASTGSAPVSTASTTVVSSSASTSSSASAPTSTSTSTSVSTSVTSTTTATPTSTSTTSIASTGSASVSTGASTSVVSSSAQTPASTASKTIASVATSATTTSAAATSTATTNAVGTSSMTASKTIASVATTSATTTSAANSALETEVKKLKEELAEANKKYEAANKQLQEKIQELESIKNKQAKKAEARKAAAEKVQLRVAEGTQGLKSAAKGTTAPSAAIPRGSVMKQRSTIMRDPAQRGSIKPEARQSIKPGTGAGLSAASNLAGGAAGSRQSVMKPKVSATDMLSLLLDQMGKLEARMKKAEASRLQAENEVLEMAVYKQTSDDMCNFTLSTLKEKLAELSNVVKEFSDTISSCSDAATKTKLTNALQSLEKVNKALAEHVKDQEAAKALSERIGAGAGVSAPPAPAPAPPKAPKAPAPPVMNANPPPPPSLANFNAKGSTGNLFHAGAGSRTSTLLDQIRRGKQLNKLDMQQIAVEREKTVRSARKSMAMLASLQDTLRAALNSRTESLMGNDEEYYEDEEDDWYD